MHPLLCEVPHPATVRTLPLNNASGESGPEARTAPTGAQRVQRVVVRSAFDGPDRARGACVVGRWARQARAGSVLRPAACGGSASVLQTLIPAREVQ
jgi:hypothetical protein